MLERSWALSSGMVGSLLAMFIAITTAIVSARPSARFRSELVTCCAYVRRGARRCALRCKSEGVRRDSGPARLQVSIFQ